MPGKWDGKSRPTNDAYRRNFMDIFEKEKEITDISMKQSIANKKERLEKEKAKAQKNKPNKEKK